MEPRNKTVMYLSLTTGSVYISSPPDGSTVSGTVPIAVDATPDIVRVKLYIDGVYTQNEAARVAVERELRVAGKSANGNGKAPANSAQWAGRHQTGGQYTEHPSDEHPLSDHNEPISPLV